MWNSPVPVEKLGEGGLHHRIDEQRMGWETANRPLSFAVLEKFDLAQALFGFGFALVGAAEILALF